MRQQRLDEIDLGLSLQPDHRVPLVSPSGRLRRRRVVFVRRLALPAAGRPVERRVAGVADVRIGTAVEELVRYSSPVIFMRRTVTRDHRMNGQDFHEGDKAVLYYWSANQDETVFADPARLDITRSPNPHVGFGAAGPHFCLGAHLARREITVMLRELLTRIPDIRAAGPPDRLLSSFINGVKHLPCTFGG